MISVHWFTILALAVSCFTLGWVLALGFASRKG